MCESAIKGEVYNDDGGGGGGGGGGNVRTYYSASTFLRVSLSLSVQARSAHAVLWPPLSRGERQASVVRRERERERERERRLEASARKRPFFFLVD